MSKMRSFLFSMLKVGVIGFGGGNALIPVLEQEVVKEKNLVQKEEFDKDIIAATLTPGALPVELASGVGLQACGIGGMVAGGVVMALPGALFTVLLMSILGILDSGIMEQIQYASIGVTAFIMCLLTEYILDTVRSYQKSRFRVFLWCIIAGVFLATGGRNLLKIFHVGVSIPQMSTIQILLLTLAGSIVVGTFRKSGDKKEKKIQRIGLKPLFKRTGIWLVLLLLLSVPAYFLVSGKAIVFDMHGLASSLLSFGGGDAYLTIADGLFVPDYIGTNEFYNHLVLVVNVLPGSILCKTLSGIGYVYGVSITGSVAGGISLAVAGFACSVSASCGIFYIIYHLYDWLERVDVFVVIKKTIRVVVSGLLLTVMTGLIQSGIAMNANPELPWFTVLLLIGILYVINLILYHRKTKNLPRIIVSLVLSLLVCNIMGI